MRLFFRLWGRGVPWLRRGKPRLYRKLGAIDILIFPQSCRGQLCHPETALSPDWHVNATDCPPVTTGNSL
jgi:hypothetical protein